ncbi:FAD-binding oxidoreductase [Nakamurella sp. GG22]
MSIQDIARPGTERRTRAESLRGLCGGAVHLPGDPGFDEARMAWNLAVDQRPAAVAYPATAEETAEVVRAAAAAGLRVAPQSTGHNAGPLGRLDDVVIVRTSAMTQVSIDPVRQVARVGGGVLWLPAVEAAAAQGFATLHGSSPDVGVAGYSLGGGMGWYARKLGLATNNITGLEVVTADGTVRWADAQQNQELFWALRGGGGSFGIVTALEFRIFPFRSAFGGMMVWDRTETERVLRRWVVWTGDAPDEVTTSFRVLNLPPIPDIPPPFRGRSLVVIDGAVLASDERSSEILAALRDLKPEIDTFGRMPAASLVGIHMDPEGPTPAVSNTVMLDGMPDAAIDTFVGLSGPDSQSSLLMSELRQLGGALGRPHPGAGALPMLDGAFVAFGGGMAMTPEMGAATLADATAFVDALSPFGSARQYLNFVEHAIDPSVAYDPVAWGRLVTIKSAFDPDGIIVGNHSVRRTFEIED